MSPDSPVNTPSADPTQGPQQPQEQNAPAPSADQDAQEKYAAAQREAAEWRGRAEARAEEINRLKKAVLNEPEVTPPEPKPATTSDLATMKDEIRWELKNESQIALADQHGKFSEYVNAGKSKQDALKLALFDEGITNTAKASETMRQAAAASASQGVDRTSPDSPIENFPKAEYDKMKAKGLSDQRIKEIVQAARDRAAKRR